MEPGRVGRRVLRGVQGAASAAEISPASSRARTVNASSPIAETCANSADATPPRCSGTTQAAEAIEVNMCSSLPTHLTDYKRKSQQIIEESTDNGSPPPAQAVARPTRDLRRSVDARQPSEPTLLAGGNPQIPKGDGDAPAGVPRGDAGAGSGDVGRAPRRPDRPHGPRGREQAVRWNSPFYGVEGLGWFLSFHCFTKYVKVTFFAGVVRRSSRCRPSRRRTPTPRYVPTSTSTRARRRSTRSCCPPGWRRRAASPAGSPADPSALDSGDARPPS